MKSHRISKAIFFSSQIHQCNNLNDCPEDLNINEFFLEVCYQSNENSCETDEITITATDDLNLNESLVLPFDLVELNDPVFIIANQNIIPNDLYDLLLEEYDGSINIDEGGTISSFNLNEVFDDIDLSQNGYGCTLYNDR